ncbi:inositol-3-phosphate synthase [Clostridium botulinum]|uniref:inositol-3-phosphate synthase n=1 Tax=Clostridium botulinum TaxID=1491 RepID=UPI001FD6BA31|nr:inositol-3-phosphate synthase [Clostridium botulinum]MCJ8174438.1 inositol-3-phosphate synthase [Clostridium botulinum]
MNKNIRVAIAGVGSCASSLVQLVYMAKEKESNEDLAGVMCNKIGGYLAKDIDFVCAFDVDNEKIGLNLGDAIFSKPNVAVKHLEVPKLGVNVEVGPLFDGIDGQLSEIIKPHPNSLKNDVDFITKRLKETEADVLVCYMPTGAKDAVRAYAIASLNAKVAFINANPELVVRDEELQRRFAENNVPLLGDDMRSHLGATTLHTALIELMHSRGIEITNTYQLNFGGNMDFLNLASPNRSISKQKSKKNALFAAGIDASRVSAGPNGYVEYLGDNKVCYLRLEGNSVLNSDISMEIRLQVEDSPNSAGVIINAVRVAKGAKDKNIGGVIDDVCPLLFKSPRVGATETKGLQSFVNFVDFLNSTN